MAYKPRSLVSLIHDIDGARLLLPHIQRPFVWDNDQMKRLLDSLMQNYPIQTLLFWRTKDEIKARKFMAGVDRDADLSTLYNKQMSAEGFEKVFVLDGQQRLQTLYALFHGTIKSPDGKSDQEAYLDVSGGHEVQQNGLLYDVRFSTSPLAPSFYRLRNLMESDAGKTPVKIAAPINKLLDTTLLNETSDAREERRERVLENVSQLRSMLMEENHFWVQELDGVSQKFPYKRVLDIFVRVNSGGTRLEAADLMFAAMKEGWEEIEEQVEGIVNVLNNGRLAFDKTFALKCLVVAHNQGAELTPSKFTSDEGKSLLAAIEKDWVRAEETFKQLRDFIQQELKVYSDRVVRSYSSFVPLFDYLYHNPKPDERDRVLLRAYYYKSQLFNWYGAQTDGVINVMHGHVGKKLGRFPIDDVMKYFATSRGASVELTEDHLGDMRLRYIILNLIYVERFGTSPFNVLYKENEPQIDHIYPQSALRSQLGLATDEINSIGNYRFLGANDNNRKRAEKPAQYFTRLKADGVPIENHLLLMDVANDPTKLVFDSVTYRDFRDRRLAAIFKLANKIVNAEKP